jgi:hypothetical protein
VILTYLVAILPYLADLGRAALATLRVSHKV